MKLSYFKVFLSKHSERLWLDSMGKNGMLLDSANDSRFKFKHSEEHTYSYSVEHIGVAPESDAAKEYYEKLSESGIKPLLSSGQWVYFVKEDGEIGHTEEKYRKNAKPYFARSLYFLGFALAFAVASGYQFYAIDMLRSVQYVSATEVIGKINLLSSEGFLNKLLNVLISIVNFFIKIANWYIGLWQSWLGKSDAVAVLSVLLPLMAILTVLCGISFTEYLTFRKEAKKAKDSIAKDEFSAEEEPVEENVTDTEPAESAEEMNETEETEEEERNAEQGIQDKTE